MIDNSTFDNRTALFHTFGCKLNFAETSTVARMLAAHGVRRVAVGETPDIIVINSCSVTEVADKKCRQAIRSFHKRYPRAAIIVTGCYAQLKPEQIAEMEGVKVVAGNDRKLQIARIIDELREESPVQSLVTPSKDSGWVIWN